MEAEPSIASTSKSKRRRFQFRLRTLMIAVTLLAIPCAFGPPLIHVGRVGDTSVYEPNLEMIAVVVLELIGWGL
jgi:hypothetical protein